MFIVTENERLMQVALNRRKKIQERLLKWALKNLRDFPWRKERTPYKIMVAEFLLKRTTSTAVGRIYNEFLRRYPGVNELSKVDVTKLEVFLETIGYHKLRARAFKETSKYIIENFKGSVPNDIKSLLSIPNIGPYTAGAILSLGYNQAAPMLDSNVERIFKRIFKNTIPQKAVFKKLLHVAKIIVPEANHDVFNLALLDLGALVCTYRSIYCYKCPINQFCDTGELDIDK